MVTAQGRYSILSDAWVQAPGEAPETDQHKVDEKAGRLIRTIDAAIEQDDQERLEGLMERLKAWRDDGIEDEGEYSFENLVYKELRRAGALNRLKQAALREYDEALSYSCGSCGTGPQKYSKSDWIPYQGPQGGKGWQHTISGRIEYGDQPPGEDQEPDDYGPDMGAEPEGDQNEPDPWSMPSEPEIDVVGQKGVTEGQIQDMTEPDEPEPPDMGGEGAETEPDPWDTPTDPKVTPSDSGQWEPVKGQQGLWKHKQTGETMMSKDAPSLSKATDIAAQARAGGAAKKPPAPAPAQPVTPPEPVATAQGVAQGVAQPPASFQGNTRRNWRSGQNAGSVEFEDTNHRDLFDIAAKQSQALRASGKTDHATQKGLLEKAKFLRDSLAQRMGVTPQEVNQMANDVYASAKEQAKGIQEGEHRKLKRPPGQPGQASPPPTAQPSGQTGQAPPAVPKPIRGDHPAAKKLDALPDGTQLYGYTKETPEGLGMSVWTKDDDAIGTNQLIKDPAHQTPEHQAELKQALESAKAAAAPAGNTTAAAAPEKPPVRDYTPEESESIHTASSIFGIAPGDVGNQRLMENFLLRTARNTGFNPDSIAGDRSDRTAAAAKHLASQRPHLNAMIQMAKGYGWGGGSGREIAHSARHAGLHLLKAAVQRGYEPEGNTEQEHVAGAITHLQQHEQSEAAQQHSRNQAVSEGLRQLFAAVKQHVGGIASGQRKITPLDIAIAALGFYVGYQMVRRMGRRRQRRRWR